jgi:hypothetical protein
MKSVVQLGLVFLLGVSAGLIGHERWHSVGLAGAPPTAPAMRSESALGQARRHLDPKFICPMHPDVVRGEPGSCPICGMGLVERADDAGPHSPSVVVAPGMVDQLGVRTARVWRRSITRSIEAPGYSTIGAGGPVGQYAQAAGSESEGGTRGPPVTVWAQIFERQANWVRVGQTAEVRLPSLSSEVIPGKVQYVDTKINRITGTLEVRIRLDQTPAEIKPNMYAVVSIEADRLDDVLAIPRDALIETEGSTRVIVALGGGRFAPREVRVQRRDGEQVAVLEGLQEGEDVVVASQFLLDSEASLEAGLRRLASVGAADPSAMAEDHR